MGVASHWHRYFGGRGLKSLGTPDLEHKKKCKHNFMIFCYFIHMLCHVEEIGTLKSPVLKKFKDMNRHEKANTVRFLF